MDEHLNRIGRFVTRIAWLLIGLSIAMTVLATAQYTAFLHTLATIENVHRGALSRSPTTTHHLALIARLVVGGASLAASIGLLKRWRWSRFALMVLATMGLASNAYGLAVAWSSTSSVRIPDDAPGPEIWIIRLSGFLSVAYPIGACLFLGWLIVKLMSRSVRREFGLRAGEES